MCVVAWVGGWCVVMWGGEGCRGPPTAPLLSLLSGHNSPLGSGAIDREEQKHYCLDTSCNIGAHISSAICTVDFNYEPNLIPLSVTAS